VRFQAGELTDHAVPLDHHATPLRIRDDPLATFDGHWNRGIVLDRDEINEGMRAIRRSLELRHVNDSVDRYLETGKFNGRRHRGK
jgi:hypothetical protein